MDIFLYNTLTKKKKKIMPIKKGEVKIYSCGPTVYSNQHIGNLRSCIFWDLLKNVFRYFNYKILDVLNITDVGHLVSDSDLGEDKMVKASKLEKKNPSDIARKYEKNYLECLKKLNIKLPKKIPRATEHIKEQIEIIKKIEKKGLTYKTYDGIYFDTQKYKKYGELSNKKIKISELKNRVKKKNEKKHPFDFALWKFLVDENEKHKMKWKSPWGVGFPGWHIECSAMSQKYLGKKFDIHTGGIEHIPIHHEAEISQNKASSKNSKINFWIHNNHLLVNSQKMAKSLGNIYLLEDLEKKGFSPLDFRFYCLKFNFRDEMDFTFEGLKQARDEREKILNFYFGFCEIKTEKKSFKSEIKKKYLEFVESFEKNLCDNLNFSSAITNIFVFINFCYTLKDENGKNCGLTKEEKFLKKNFLKKLRGF